MKIIKRLPGLPVERALGVLSGRWKAVILDVLMDGPQRTCELEKRIVGISQKVLIEQLRALEEHGMVGRQPSAGDSQGIEYLLTPLGESLRPVLDSLIEWGTHHARELDEVHRLLPCDAVVRDRTAIAVRDVRAACASPVKTRPSSEPF
jgi:DNA-binding HxlR family transcriptional regulator